ncbi:MAG: hypothetical protein IJF78_04630, partial [Clostridia bacterium]|nr:hypothetical protein [Clostridia bacterium]
MKFLLALLMLLTLASCTDTESEDFVFDQEHIDVTLEPEALYCAMNERDVIGIRDPAGIFPTDVMPLLYQTETKGYLMPTIPEEILLSSRDTNILREPIHEYRISGELLNFIEIYATPDCTGEPESVVELTGMENRIIYQWLSVDEETGHFTCIGIEKNYKDGYFYEFSETGEMLRRIPIRGMDIWHQRLVNLSHLEGNVYYYLQPIPGTFELDALYDVYRLDFSDSSSEGKKELIEENIAAADFEGDTVYYLKRKSDNYLDADGDLYRMDLTTLEKEELAEMNVIKHHATPILRLVMDTKNNLVYYSTLKDVFTFDPETGEVVHVIHSGGASVNPTEIIDSTLYCEIGYAGYFIYDLPAEPIPYTDGLEPLKFVGYRPGSASDAAYYPKASNNPYTYTNVFDLMQTNGYGSYSEASVYTNKEEYAYAMAKKLMAGDTDFDLFYVSTEMAQLFDSQYYEDLTRYSRLSRDYFDEMVPGLRDICTIDGRLSLVPLSLNAQIMVIDNSLAEGSVTFPRTVDDLLTLADSVTLTDGSYLMGGTRAATVLRKLFEEFAANYILSDIDDETALADLTNLYEMCTLLGENEKMLLSRGYFSQKQLITFGMNNGIDVIFRGDIQSGSLPKINENYKTPVSGEFWAINPNSE